ncbi:efflux RND transporter periplasmic adaptor subunit [Shewanella salipaludis]|uniref:Efflux RND transporter periplasmic adaptor subunit n=1 Tax=Shewanella salipaludis TaxID=2723052 RepID=A0A972G5R9_9GAMM|nr:efflux RND transporter periplasmic adaptor subunit [Shewanella salipaludis]NMH64980.1 efflux RND transporter periplasmic adaptor subunit [Shewanella salipaludis]
MRHVLKVASIIGLGLWVGGCKPSADQASAPGPAPMEVGTMNVVAQPQALQVELPGRSHAFLEAEVRPQVSGIITKRSFTEGGLVAQGESLYQIDPATYQAALVSAEAQKARAVAALASAKARAKRYAELVKTKAISQQDFDEAQAAYQESLASVTVADAAINTAKINLQYTQVLAPISGRIGKSSVTAGALVTANQGQALATIQQLDPINVDIVQSSAQLLSLKARLRQGKLQADDNASVELILEDGSHYGHPGKLRFSEVSVDESTGTVIIRAEFPNPEGILLPGMYVRALVNVGTDPAAILVPQKAITRNAKGQAVAMLVNEQGQVESRVVKTAEVIDHQWRVTEGMTAGETLIVEGLQKIRPGAQVTTKTLSANQAD